MIQRPDNRIYKQYDSNIMSNKHLKTIASRFKTTSVQNSIENHWWGMMRVSGISYGSRYGSKQKQIQIKSNDSYRLPLLNNVSRESAWTAFFVSLYQTLHSIFLRKFNSTEKAKLPYEIHVCVDNLCQITMRCENVTSVQSSECPAEPPLTVFIRITALGTN